MAFFGISMFALLSAIASIYAFSKIGDVLSGITQERMPAALVSQEISLQAERIVAAAPALLTLTSIVEQEEFSKQFATDIARLNQLLTELKRTTTEGTDLEVIEGSVEALNLNLISIDTAVYDKVVMSQHKRELLGELFDLYDETRLVLSPALLEADETTSDLREQLEESDLAKDEREDVERELLTGNESLSFLLKSQLELLSTKNKLLEISSTKNAEDLPATAISVGWAIDTLVEIASEVDEHLRKELLAKFVGFRGLLTGQDSIVATRQRELKGIESITDLLARNEELSRVLIGAVADLVTRLRQDVNSANTEALAVQRQNINILIAIVASSLSSSILIVWLYVGRSLLRRLTALSESMLAIAGGDLRAALPAAGGNDEIGDMAKALVVFRDTAVEVRKSNLREINEARRRLTDAIETISEGFSLFDADDRLIVSNSTYRKLLYPGIEDVVVPGASFEEIVRAAAERGLVADAEGGVDQWVDERVRQHRNPGHPLLQRVSDGRWIMINERETEDGGSVAVYSDITELKDREVQLAEKSDALEGKSNAMEQLSNQLAKYLSPQVYDSIFTGKQEVKVSASRKQLTVFFSDIVAFTETADRLESEELTKLLNHYLTEMSCIALDYGATIDKYVGDAILIFFGDPETKGDKEDALACVEMAIAMRKRMHELAGLWRESGIEKPLRIRMGIHTGFCTVGNFGSEDRMDYTIIGGAVNTASRLESLAAPGEILISYETFARVKDRIRCEEHGETEVKGIAYSVATYRVIDSFANLDSQRRRFHADHSNVKLDIDLEAMTRAEREPAADVLRRALDLLTESEKSETL